MLKQQEIALASVVEITRRNHVAFSQNVTVTFLNTTKNK